MIRQYKIISKNWGVLTKYFLLEEFVLNIYTNLYIMIYDDISSILQIITNITFYFLFSPGHTKGDFSVLRHAWADRDVARNVSANQGMRNQEIWRKTRWCGWREK